MILSSFIFTILLHIIRDIDIPTKEVVAFKTTSQAATFISRQQSASSGGFKSAEAEVKQPSNSGDDSAKSKSSTLASSAAPKSSTQQQQKKQAAVPPLPSDSKTGNDSSSAPPPIDDTEESLSTQIREIESLIKEAEANKANDDELASSLREDHVHLLGRKAKITNEDSDLKDFVDAIKAIKEDDSVTEKQKGGITARVEDIGMFMFVYSML